MKSLEEVKAGLDPRGVQGGGTENAGRYGPTVESCWPLELGWGDGRGVYHLNIPAEQVFILHSCVL